MSDAMHPWQLAPGLLLHVGAFTSSDINTPHFSSENLAAGLDHAYATPQVQRFLLLRFPAHVQMGRKSRHLFHKALKMHCIV